MMRMRMRMIERRVMLESCKSELEYEHKENVRQRKAGEQGEERSERREGRSEERARSRMQSAEA